MYQGYEFHPFEEVNAIAGSLEMQFTTNDLCNENHERRIDARVQGLLETADNSPLRG
jgi:hypothetical protein